MIDPNVFLPIVEDHPARALAVAAVSGHPPYSLLGRPIQGLLPLGSITKLFSGLLLAAAIVRDEIELNDEIGNWIEVENPDLTVRSISIVNLATHSSGLPREAPSIMNRYERDELDLSNPYEGFVEGDLLQDVSSVELTGLEFQYSNFGMMLLAVVLQRAAGRPYSELLQERIFRPLGMASTSVRSAIPEDKLEQGHDAAGIPVPHWDEPLPGAGGVVTSPSDLASFLAAVALPDQTPIAHEIALATTPHFEPSDREMAVGLGWLISVQNGKTWLQHNGATGGFHSHVAISPGLGAAGVVANWLDDPRSAQVSLTNALGIRFP